MVAVLTRVGGVGEGGEARAGSDDRLELRGAAEPRLVRVRARVRIRVRIVSNCTAPPSLAWLALELRAKASS